MERLTGTSKKWWDNDSTPLTGAIYNIEDFFPFPNGYARDFMKLGYFYEDAVILGNIVQNIEMER